MTSVAERSREVRVLHVLDCYLPTTENWIYPQITGVPGVTTAILCRRLENSEQYPANNRPLFLQTPREACTNRFARLSHKLLGTMGFQQKLTALRAWLWSPSVIHAHFGWIGFQTLELRRALGVPMITAFYGWEAWSLPVREPSWTEKYRELWRDGDHFLVEGPAMRQRLIDIGCPEEKIRIRRLGVDLSKITYSAPHFSKVLKVAMIGRFVEKKGLPDGLAACLKAAKRGVNLEVTIIGDAPPHDRDGQEIKRQLLSLAEEPALAGRVCLTGFLPHRATFEILKQQNVLLCPSKHAVNGDAEGGIPFVLAEAMAMGVIGIGSRHCDMEDLIIDRRTGYLFNEGDVHGLTELLCNMPSGVDQLRKIAEAARRHIEQNFGLEQQLVKLGDIYRYCVERKRSRAPQNE